MILMNMISLISVVFYVLLGHESQGIIEPMLRIPSSSSCMPQLVQIHRQSNEDQWLKISESLTNYTSKGFNDYWLSTTKTQPMKYTGRKLQNQHQRSSLPSVAPAVSSSSSPVGKLFREALGKMGGGDKITKKQNKGLVRDI